MQNEDEFDPFDRNGSIIEFLKEFERNGTPAAAAGALIYFGLAKIEGVKIKAPRPSTEMVHIGLIRLTQARTCDSTSYNATFSELRKLLGSPSLGSWDLSEIEDIVTGVLDMRTEYFGVETFLGEYPAGAVRKEFLLALARRVRSIEDLIIENLDIIGRVMGSTWLENSVAALDQPYRSQPPWWLRPTNLP